MKGKKVKGQRRGRGVATRGVIPYQSRSDGNLFLRIKNIHCLDYFLRLRTTSHACMSVSTLFHRTQRNRRTVLSFVVDGETTDLVTWIFMDSCISDWFGTDDGGALRITGEVFWCWKVQPQWLEVRSVHCIHTICSAQLLGLGLRWGVHAVAPM